MINSRPKFDDLRPNPDLAQLPLFDRKGWKRVRFGEVVENVNETEREPLEAGINRFIGLEHLVPKDLHIRSWGNVADGTTFTRCCRPGQVLFGKRRAYQRKVAVAEFDAVVSGDIYVLAPKDVCLLPGLLPFLCMSDRFFDHAVGTSAGSLSPRTNWKSLAKFEFDLPPLEQQRRLADILWAIDQTAVEWGKVAERAEEGLESMRKEHFETSIERGKSVLLSDVGKWKSGNTPSRSRSDYWKGELPWVSPKDMKVVQIWDTQEHLTEAGWEQSSTVPQGSLLIVIRGMILVHSFPVAIAGREVAFNQDMKALIVNGDYSNDYMFNWFQWAKSSLLRNISESSHGTKRLTTDVLFSQQVPKIGRREQDAFVQSVLKADSVAADAQSHIFCSREFLKAFLNTIFR
jgi:type I restriction enzyme, S subunit